MADQLYRIRDRWGNIIELTDERWQHIITWHPDLEDHLDEVLLTVRQGRRKQDALDPYKYTYYRETDVLLPDYDYIVVIVKLIRNNFIVTAYPKFIGR